jgi:hypothetical protein
MYGTGDGKDSLSALFGTGIKFCFWNGKCVTGTVCKLVFHFRFQAPISANT